MKILMVASEAAPFAKTGGLADVIGSLPPALADCGEQVAVVMPLYRTAASRLDHAERVFDGMRVRLSANADYPVAIRRTVQRHVTFYFVECPELFDRPQLYGEAGEDYIDNHIRFAVLCRAALGVIRSLFRPDIVHCHDWQAALTPVYLRYRFRSTLPVVCTIHNLAFQGQFSYEIAERLELPHSALGTDCLEYYGGVGYLKGGILCSDVVTTVSPTYAREILSSDLGMGLDGVLQGRRSALYGIVNGIDADIWSPSTDPLIPRQYDARSLPRRQENRATLLRRFGMADAGGPLFAALTRLTWQKGADMFPDAAEEIVSHGGQFVVCGQGDASIEAMLRDCAARYPGHVSVHIGYAEEMAHLIVSGCDVLIQPSRFEPCGLSQMYAQRFGSLPIAHRTGGLADTIEDGVNGFLFGEPSLHRFMDAIKRGLDTFRSRSRPR